MIRHATATRRQALRAAERAGCALTDDGATISVEAPHRQRLAGADVHCLDWYYGGPMDPAKGLIYAQIIEELSWGLAPCEDPACDWCNNW